MTKRTWRLLVGLAFIVGLAVRLGSVVGRPHLHPAGDPAEYWLIANFVAEGRGWIEPIIYLGAGRVAQTAKLPPLYTMLLSLCSLVGFKSFFAHRIWSAVISAVAAPIGAALGRDVAGRTVGVIVAFGLALYPNMWMPVSIAMSETISPIMAMLVLWAGYRMARDPSLRRAALLGLAIGVAALARDEMAVFAALILLPLCLRVRPGRSWPSRFTGGWRMIAVGLGAVAVVVVPWVTFNTVRFGQPVLITDRFGATLASADCRTAWYGPLAGYWSQSCALAAVANVPGGEAAQEGPATRAALKYVSDHAGSLPEVEFERLGRTFGFWNVRQQLTLDNDVENRPRHWVWVGLFSWYALLALAPYGLWRLRKAGVPVFLLVAVLIDVLIVVLLTYGETRFRATLEPTMVVLGAVALAGLLRRPVTPFEGLGLESGLGREEPHGLQGGAVPGQALAAQPGRS